MFRLFTEGRQIPVHPDGGFLAWVPITPGDFTFGLVAFRKDYYYKVFFPDSLEFLKKSRIDTTLATKLAAAVAVRIPPPQTTITLDTLMIADDYRPPSGALTLAAGDRLEVAFRGTADCRAWFSIPGAVDSVPMSQTPPRTQPYWGESVFGAGAVPDSLMLAGVYSGFWDVPASVRIDTARITYHLAPPPPGDIFRRFWTSPAAMSDTRLIKYLVPKDTVQVKRASGYTITLNDPAFPLTVRFTDSVQIVRHEPGKGYFAIFQPRGVEALAVGAEGDWYRLKLSHTQQAWANVNSVEPLPKGILPVRSYLSSVRTYDDPYHLTIEFPLAGKHLFRVIEDDKRTLRIQLYGVTSNTDWIRYDFADRLIDVASWSQPEKDLYEFRVRLTQDIWGYDTHYTGNTFRFRLHKPPPQVHTLKGKTVVIDPGHSNDPGAVGPTGYTEAEANLGIALAVRDKLRSKGVRVIMTREDNSHVPLYDRPAIAKMNDADLFVSIHNNAVPDGVNPFTNHGTSSYYYHPHSIDLARAIHAEMIKATRLPDFGLFYGNLAVNRPTQYPAVLVECAFQIIPEHEAMLKTDDFRKRVAGAIVRGIENFLKGYNRGK